MRFTTLLGQSRCWGKKSDTGAAFPEYALVFPLIFAFVLTFLDLGRFFYMRGAALHAASRAASFLSVTPTLDNVPYGNWNEDPTAWQSGAPDPVAGNSRVNPVSFARNEALDRAREYGTFGELGTVDLTDPAGNSAIAFENIQAGLRGMGPTMGSPLTAEETRALMEGRPIEVTIVAQIRPISPWIGARTFTVSAAAYREGTRGASNPVAVDCHGNAITDPNAPLPDDCTCPDGPIGSVYNQDGSCRCAANRQDSTIDDGCCNLYGGQDGQTTQCLCEGIRCSDNKFHPPAAWGATREEQCSCICPGTHPSDPRRGQHWITTPDGRCDCEGNFEPSDLTHEAICVCPPDPLRGNCYSRGLAWTHETCDCIPCGPFRKVNPGGPHVYNCLCMNNAELGSDACPGGLVPPGGTGNADRSGPRNGCECGCPGTLVLPVGGTDLTDCRCPYDPALGTHPRRLYCDPPLVPNMESCDCRCPVELVPGVDCRGEGQVMPGNPSISCVCDTCEGAQVPNGDHTECVCPPSTDTDCSGRENFVPNPLTCECACDTRPEQILADEKCGPTGGEPYARRRWNAGDCRCEACPGPRIRHAGTNTCVCPDLGCVPPLQMNEETCTCTCPRGFSDDTYNGVRICLYPGCNVESCINDGDGIYYPPDVE